MFAQMKFSRTTELFRQCPYTLMNLPILTKGREVVKE